MPSSQWPSYTWDANARQYRGPDGRFVPRTAVRQALDEAIDQASLDVQRHALDLQAGAINLPEWQLRMEASLKAIHVMSTALACGGWAQATAADWALAGRRLREQYGYLYRFARQIEAGLPLDGRFVARAMMYANAGSGTYEAALRRRDLATGTVLRERRLLHSGHPCPSCIEYHALGWQPPGVLPDIGQQCECHSNCRCSFQRQFGAAGALPTVTIPPRTPPAAPAQQTPRPRPKRAPRPLVARTPPDNPLPQPFFAPKAPPAAQLPPLPRPEAIPAQAQAPAAARPKPPAVKPKPKAKPAPLPRKKAPIRPARASKPTGRPNPPNPAAKPPAPAPAAPALDVRGDVSPELRATIEREIANLPPKVKQALASTGKTFVLGRDMRDVLGSRASQAPRGWEAGMSWEHADGAYIGDGRIAVSEYQRGMHSGEWQKSARPAQVFRHETGHGLDDALGSASRSAEFRRAYAADLARMDAVSRMGYAYFTQPGEAGPHEAFAELVAQELGGGPGSVSLDRVFPESAKVVRGLVR